MRRGWRSFVFVSVVAALLALVPPRVPRAAPGGGSVVGKVVVTKDGKPATRNFVFAYLLRTRIAKRPEPTPVKTSIAQKDFSFNPRVRVIPTRSRIEFPNDDQRRGELHNVFSPSKPRFDLGSYPPGKSNGQTFEHAGEFDVYCDKHQGMAAKVKVVDTDLIARVEGGAFRFDDVPPGKYELHIWTPNNDETVETVTVVAGQTVELPYALKLPLKRIPSAAHFNKNNTPYAPCTYPNSSNACKVPTDALW